MTPPRGRDLSPEPKLVNTLGSRIRAIRTTWMWTQVALADALRSNQKTVSHWELDAQVPGDVPLGVLSQLTGISAESLRTGVGFDLNGLPNPPRQIGALLVAEDQAVNLVHLPKISGTGITFVDRPNEYHGPLLLEQAIKKMTEAYKKKQPVWLVVGDLWG